MKKKKDKFVCELCGADVKETDTFCPDCGAIFVRNLFLCNNHDSYEIYEGMARVFGSSDELEAQYVYDSLLKNKLHPYVYYRKVSPISMGGPDYTLFRASGEYDGHIINEIKVMVPCSEVLSAEKVLREIELI